MIEATRKPTDLVLEKARISNCSMKETGQKDCCLSCAPRASVLQSSVSEQNLAIEADSAQIKNYIR